MPTPSQPDAPSTAEIDAGWDALIEDAATDAEPRHRVSQTLARMAAMMDAREGTGPVLDLRKVSGPSSRPAEAPARDPEVGAPMAEVYEDASLDVSEVDLLELGSPQEILDDAPRIVEPPPPRPVLREIATDVPANPPVASAPTPRLRPWMAVGLGAGAVLIGLWWFARPRPVAEMPTTEVREAAIQVVATPEVTPARAPVVVPTVPAQMLAHADPPKPPEPVVEALPAHVEAPVIIEPEAAEPSSVAEARAALEADRFADAYAIASRRWKDARDNDALQIMVAAACQQDDGRLARRAFHSLAGPQARETVFVQCRRRGIDLGARTPGYTASELLIRARRAASTGDHGEARSLARESLALARTPEAMVLIGVSACRLGKLDEARRLNARLHRDDQAQLALGCEAAGVTL